jgi:solute carrier family 12 sodium/potassium/chloride transporter 2
VSLVGSVLCVVIMFLMEPIYAGVTLGVLLVLGLYILYRNPEANWGSSTQGQVFVSAVKAAVNVTGKNQLFSIVSNDYSHI